MSKATRKARQGYKRAYHVVLAARP
eukprot:COSAG04_NODE_22057_length_362_cov_0.775665_2_plen_24_part_01